jgi:hypothetical protein
MIESGIYVIQFSPDNIKVGRSSRISTRIRQYNGYSPRGQARVLAKIYCRNEIEIERRLHRYLRGTLKLHRYYPYEIFKVDPAKLDEVLLKIKRFV